MKLKFYYFPLSGTKTEKRGHKAGHHVSQEVVQVCGLIYLMGAKMPNGKHAIKFGKLFNIYQSISNKLVGMLLRARKHGLVDFPGEMLYQRRDEEVILWLVEIPPAVQEWIDLHDWEKYENENAT